MAYKLIPSSRDFVIQVVFWKEDDLNFNFTRFIDFNYNNKDHSRLTPHLSKHEQINKCIQDYIKDNNLSEYAWERGHMSHEWEESYEDD